MYRINVADQLPDDLTGTVGVTAGASAPEELVEAVLDRLAPTHGVDVVRITDEDEYFPPPRNIRELPGLDRDRQHGAARWFAARLARCIDDRNLPASEVLAALADWTDALPHPRHGPSVPARARRLGVGRRPDRARPASCPACGDRSPTPPRSWPGRSRGRLAGVRDRGRHGPVEPRRDRRGEHHDRLPDHPVRQDHAGDRQRRRRRRASGRPVSGQRSPSAEPSASSPPSARCSAATC